MLETNTTSIINNTLSPLDNKYYAYTHYRLSDGILFYIGQGEGKRAESIKGRNKH